MKKLFFFIILAIAIASVAAVKQGDVTLNAPSDYTYIQTDASLYSGIGL